MIIGKIVGGAKLELDLPTLTDIGFASKSLRSSDPTGYQAKDSIHSLPRFWGCLAWS
jgi:hypothetical protein